MPQSGVALLGAGVSTLVFSCAPAAGADLPRLLVRLHRPHHLLVQTGQGATMFGLFCAGFMYFVFAAIVRWRGMAMVNRLLPPVVIGPVIMIIGLSVASAASNMAMGRAGGNQIMPYETSLLLAAVSLATTIVVSIFARGMFKLVPILRIGVRLLLSLQAGACGAGFHGSELLFMLPVVDRW
jgi:uracil permease